MSARNTARLLASDETPEGRPALRPAMSSAPAARESTGPRCGCGHGRQAHEHYRRGKDCSLCACARFRRWWLIGRRRR